MPRPRKPTNPFHYFHSPPDIIRMVVMLYVRVLAHFQRLSTIFNWVRFWMPLGWAPMTGIGAQRRH